MISRRGFALGAGVMISGLGPAAWALPETLAQEFARIEAESGGRLGVAVLDTRDGARAEHRAGERFPMTSTFKLLAAAALLARVDAGQEQLERRIRYEEKHLVTYSPVTGERLGIGMTLAEIGEAAVTWSDNTAGNLLLANIGGPEGLTAFARKLGDGMTRLDRIETQLNEATPGDPRDTTTPAAMAANIRLLVLGKTLSHRSRDLLKSWLVACKTGDARLRAGVPKDWVVGEKTGSGGHGTTTDVGLFGPPGREPLIVTAYLTGTGAPEAQRNAAIAAVGRAVAAARSA